MLRINKKRASDLSSVEVDIVRGGSAIITSGQLAVTLYQRNLQRRKCSPAISGGYLHGIGDLISDSHELSFDLASENPASGSCRFVFCLPARPTRQTAGCVPQARGKSSRHFVFQGIQSLRYTMRISFTSDFDF